jgi:hypothetical protein
VVEQPGKPASAFGNHQFQPITDRRAAIEPEVPLPLNEYGAEDADVTFARWENLVW